MQTVDELTQRAVASWGLSPFIATEAKKIIQSASESKDLESLESTIGRITAAKRDLKFPLSYLKKCLSSLPDKRAERPRPPTPAPSAYRVTADEDGYLRCPKPEEGNELQERIYETADRINHERFFREMDRCLGKHGRGVVWKHPGESFENKARADYLRSVYGPRLADYDSHTWIALKEQADRESVTIHELCRRYGLNYEALII